eukprot:TRINITY_DN9574_c0_g1_i1.p1 TRINITY_DN9574_c0_g1~~TRINITY_DN9574_c0_g1_i1.p1  ORF type:complete len:534 (+),score=55.80 TRINITY_DN9574_c0_g1_i1:61-1602(+)
MLPVLSWTLCLFHFVSVVLLQVSGTPNSTRMLLDGTSTEIPTQGAWTYPDQKNWGMVVGSFCSRKGAQSPIDIGSDGKEWAGSEKHKYKTASTGMQLGPIAWKYSKNTLKVDFSEGWLDWAVRLHGPSEQAAAVTSFEGVDYQLDSITFKSPSEHTVKGNHAHMEIQLNHAVGPKTLLITSVLVEVQDDAPDNAWLAKFWDKAPPSPEEPVTEIKNIEIDHPYETLYPKDHSVVQYEGSLTVPPCNKAEWLVFVNPISMSLKQLQQFRDGISNYKKSPLTPGSDTNPSIVPPTGLTKNWDLKPRTNNRLVQDLGKRKLLFIEELKEPEIAKGWIGWDLLQRVAWLLLACIIVGLIIAGCVYAHRRRQLVKYEAHEEEEEEAPSSWMPFPHGSASEVNMELSADSSYRQVEYPVWATMQPVESAKPSKPSHQQPFCGCGGDESDSTDDSDAEKDGPPQLKVQYGPMASHSRLFPTTGAVQTGLSAYPEGFDASQHPRGGMRWYQTENGHMQSGF